MVCLLVVTTPPRAVAQDDPLRHGSALIIGTWAYSDRRWPPLDDINLQIKTLQMALRPHFDEVQVLSNPTFDQLDGRLREFLRGKGNDGTARLLIYYAGHGYTETDLARNEQRGYITGSDTPYVDGSQSSFDAARIKAISMEAVRGMVSDVNALQVLFVFDSCFSGTIFAARSPAEAPKHLTQTDIAKLVSLPVREFITAGDMNETVPARSPLPQLLVDALRGAADPYGLGVITGQQLAQYLWSQTRGIGISPRNGKLPGGYFDQGEFLFRTAITEPRPPITGMPPPVVPPAPPDIDNRTLNQLLQAELRRVGCYTGAADGAWDQRSTDAAEQFNRRSHASLDTRTASLEAVKAVSSHAGRVCPLVCPAGKTAVGDQCIAPQVVRERAPANPQVQPQGAKRCETWANQTFCE
jgi:hypothetical protein